MPNHTHVAFVIVLFHKLTPVLKSENILSVENYKQMVGIWKNMYFLFGCIIFLWTSSVYNSNAHI